MAKKWAPMKKDGLQAKKIPISLMEWERMHPFMTRYATDSYYCRVANRLSSIISSIVSIYYTQQDAKELALAVAAYFEDAVSELGMWRAFIEKHKQMYGRWLPWYDTSEGYFEDEINLQDVQFVLWINMMRMREGAIVNPENPALLELAAAVYEVLEEEFESAPINDEFVDEVYGLETTEVFGKLKALMLWMENKSYLLKPSIQIDEDKDSMRDTLEDIIDMSDRPGLSWYVTESYWCVAKPTGPLALRPCEWYALMREQKGITEGNDEIRKIKATPLYPFIIVRNDGVGDLLLRSVTGAEYEVARDSFEIGSDYAIQENYLTLTILAYYKGRWHVNGFSSSVPTKSRAEAEKKLAEFADALTEESGLPIDILGNLDFDSTEQFQVFMESKLVEKAVKSNGGSRLFYFPNAKEAMDWQIKAFKLKEHGGLPESSALNLGGPVAVFLTEKGKLCMVPAVHLIADPANPYFAESDAESELGIIGDKGMMPTELVRYMMQRGFLRHLALNSVYGARRGRELLQDNISFLATFLRQEPT